ncbi:prepilin-type N-terminal cleavage/methylation domain-containing protein [Rummeliibacillus suwonensis]|uniref:prepilin-type N-terminal cleavage/methylation domain-containing protein n=1 Tax=Rummeliibacillus suwonensis TaxID=1306154 RepID=UPI001FBA5B67|nr:prepilin-type N-terminal cleavage/methylation domain-containing protein [Rummeliibacillus suwonensis]
MKAKFKKLMKNQKGMTLIELLAVIVIIAIIALIAIPAIGNIINKSHDKAILSDASQLISSAKIAISDGACGEPDATTNLITCSNTDLEDYIEGEGLSLSSGDKVTKSSDGNYTVFYSKLADKSASNTDGIRTTTIQDAIDYTTSSGLAGSKLAEAMGKK